MSEWWRTAKRSQQIEFQVTDLGRHIALRFRDGAKITARVEIPPDLLQRMRDGASQLLGAARDQRQKAGIEGTEVPETAPAYLLNGFAIGVNEDGPALMVTLDNWMHIAIRIPNDRIGLLKNKLDELFSMQSEPDAVQ